MKKHSVVSCSFLILSLLVCPEPVIAQQMGNLITAYREDQSALQRKYNVTESAEFYERFKRFFDDYKRQVEVVDFDRLSGTDKVDYVLLKNQIDKDAHALALSKKEFDEVSQVTSFSPGLYDFIKNRRDGKKVPADATARMFDDMSRAFAEAKANAVKAPYASWQQAEKASAVIRSLRHGLQEAFGFYDGYDPMFSWWAAKPFAALDTALAQYAKILRNNYQNTSVPDDGSGIVGKPIGREAINKALHNEFIPYTPEELITIAEKQFAWCEQEMLKASTELGFGKDWKGAMEKVKNTFVAPGDQPAMVVGLAEEAIQFLRQRDLITIPPLAAETWRIRMMSPAAQRLNPFFLGGEEIIVSYPTNTMEHREKMMSMRGNNPHFSKATVHHELIPGHHLQQFMQRRHKPYRELFETPFWIEGWALYWEMNLWDKGFAKSPEDRIGMLFWRMHRCARIIFSLNYHLGKMTPRQCIDFLSRAWGMNTPTRKRKCDAQSRAATVRCIRLPT